jgi:hypothetical protein
MARTWKKVFIHRFISIVNFERQSFGQLLPVVGSIDGVRGTDA